jgi:phospholipid-binding lipoprotein MlaA
LQTRRGFTGSLARARRAAGLATLAAVLAVACGCATRGPDRFERVNRAVFGFNEGVDRYVLEPVAKGWDFVMPDLVQTGVGNFFSNVRMPIVMLNNVLQGKADPAVIDYCRLFVNTTVGLGGLIDVASHFGIPQNDADFGLTLGHWGVPSGAYIVLPILGPSTARDAVGRAADTAVGLSYFYFIPWPWYASAGFRTVEMVNLRAKYLEEIDESRRSSLDFYVFMRDAYLQNRKYKLRGRAQDGAPEPFAPDEDLYQLEDDLGEDDEDLEL